MRVFAAIVYLGKHVNGILVAKPFRIYKRKAAAFVVLFNAYSVRLAK